MGTTIKVDTTTWNTAVTPTQAGSTGSNDLINDINTTINSLLGALNVVGFMENSKNFITALEDFGHGLNGALACVSLDFHVVASGLGAAAAAFGNTDAALANTLAGLETQMGYYTNTATSVSLATPTAAANAALNSLNISSSSSTSFWDSTPGHILIGAGIVVAVVAVVAVVVISLPVDAIVAAGSAVVAAGAALFSSLDSVFG